MGFLPIFIMLGGAMLLWLLTVRENLRTKRTRALELQARLLALAPQTNDQARTEAARTYLVALHTYNSTVRSAPARLPASVFGFAPLENVLL